MTDESCRKCGGLMIEQSFCLECREVTKRICSKCGSETDERIHTSCFYPVSLGLLIIGFQSLDLFPAISLA